MTNKSGLSSKVLDKLASQDSFAPTLGFTLDGSDSVQHFTGGIISLSMTIFAFYLSLASLKDFLFKTNAEVTLGSKFENTNLDFTSDSMFLSLGFYNPYAQVSSNLDSDSSNSFDVSQNIKEVNITCVDCNKNDTVMSKCGEDKFQNVVISSISANQSEQIVTNLKQFSFCFPDQYTGSVVEEVPFGKSASIEMEMPFDRTVPPLEPADPAKKINTGGYSFSDVSSKVSVIQERSNQLVQEQGLKQAQAQDEYNTLVQNGYNKDDYKNNQQTNTQTGGNVPGGTTGGIATTGGTAVGGTATGGTATGGTITGGTTGGTATGGTTTGGNTTGGTTTGGTATGGTTTGGNTTGGTTTGGNTTEGTTTGGTTTGGTTTGGTTTGGTTTGGTTTGGTTTATGTTTTTGGKRILTARDLQTSECSCMDSNDYLQTANLPWELKELVTANMFPKMLFLHRSVTVNPNNEDIISFIYKLEILDYLDKFTANPIVYDIYVRKVVVEKVTGYFWEQVEESEFLEYDKIQINTMDSLANSGAKFYFKISNDVKTIQVKYTTFSDWLESLGAYTALFTSFGGSLAGFFSSHAFNQKAINTVFKFNKNRHIDIKKQIIKMKNSSSSKKDEEANSLQIGSERDLQSQKEMLIHKSHRDSSPDTKFKRVLILNKQKSKECNQVEITLSDILGATYCFSFRKRKQKTYEIVNKCCEIVEKCLSVEYIMTKIFELNLMKKLFFSRYERNLLKYQNRFLNLEDPDKALEFLEEIAGDTEENPDLAQMRKQEKNEFEDLLLDNMEQYYAF